MGLVAYALVHLLIAWLAVQLALGNRAGEASNQGALRHLAGEPYGEVLIWAIAVGMFCLVCWRLLEAAVGHTDCDDEHKRLVLRLGSVGKAVIYGAVGYTALRVATGSGSGSDGRSTSAKLMDLPAGTWVVGLVGLGIIGYGGRMAQRGLTKQHRDHLTAEGKSGETGTAYLWLGTYGYVAKGIAIAIIGGLFGYAALTHDPAKSAGLDQALRTVLEQPFGPILLSAIAVGIGCYGIFCLIRARHLST